MKKKAKQIAKVMSNDSLEVVAQMIVDEAKGKVIRYHWIKAHRGNIYNEMADSLAFSAIES